MNKSATAFLASLAVVAAVAGTASAATSVDVRSVGELSQSEASQINDRSKVDSHIASVRSYLAAHPADVAALKAKGVQVNNIVDVQQTLSGDHFYIVR